MNKADVALRVASKTGISKKLASEVVEEFISTVRDALHGGDKVSLVGFGTFLVKQRKPKIGRNPKTGVEVTIPERKVAVFRPGKVFKEFVNR